jgi:ATP-dependent RNA helicase DeaD
LDDVRVVVESLANEFDLFDVAAAAIKMLEARADADAEVAVVAEPGNAPARSGGVNARPSRGSGLSTAVRLFIGAGRKARIGPGDLVGAITGEAGVTSKNVGAIEIGDNFSIVEVSEDVADAVITAMKGALLRGKKVVVRRDRDPRQS